eukprot:SAG11_NODE_34942_length_269_cov_0.611765_1_plen_86_part_01
MKRFSAHDQVITDGEPNSKAQAKAVIERQANALARDEQLSITFVQARNKRIHVCHFVTGDCVVLWAIIELVVRTRRWATMPAHRGT